MQWNWLSLDWVTANSVTVKWGFAAIHAVTVSPSCSRGANIVAEKTFTPLNVRSGRTTRLPETSRAIGASVLPERSRGCGNAHKAASPVARRREPPGSHRVRLPRDPGDD